MTDYSYQKEMLTEAYLHSVSEVEKDVQESRKVFHGNFRQTHTMANFRQEQDCQRVGSVGKGQSLRTRWMMASQTRLHILYNKD